MVGQKPSPPTPHTSWYILKWNSPYYSLFRKYLNFKYIFVWCFTAVQRAHQSSEQQAFQPVEMPVSSDATQIPSQGQEASLPEKTITQEVPMQSHVTSEPKRAWVSAKDFPSLHEEEEWMTICMRERNEWPWANYFNQSAHVQNKLFPVVLVIQSSEGSEEITCHSLQASLPSRHP